MQFIDKVYLNQIKFAPIKLSLSYYLIVSLNILCPLALPAQELVNRKKCDQLTCARNFYRA